MFPFDAVCDRRSRRAHAYAAGIVPESRDDFRIKCSQHRRSERFLQILDFESHFEHSSPLQQYKSAKDSFGDDVEAIDETVAKGRTLNRPAAGFTEADAWTALAETRGLVDVILLPVPELWAETQDLQTRYSLSFWDALLIANCLRGSVQILYTEDIGAPRTIDGLSLVNPFLGLSVP